MDLANMTLHDLRKLKIAIDKELTKRSKADGSVSEFKRIWEDFCNENGLSYYWTAKDAGCAKRIIQMMRHEIEQSGKDSNVIDALKVLFNLAFMDKWLRENFMVCNVASQFNKIINNARSKQQRITNIQDRFD